MKEYEDFLEKYAKDRKVSKEVAEKHKIVKKVKAYYLDNRLEKAMEEINDKPVTETIKAISEKLDPLVKTIESVCKDTCTNLCKYHDTCDDIGECDYVKDNGSCPLCKLY